MSELVVDYLRSYLGVPYIWAGATPMQGFDCSGLICEALKFAGLLKNHDDLSSNSLFVKYNTLPLEGVNPRAGSLVFFGTRQKVVHVAMVSSWSHMIEAGGGTEATRNVDLAIQRGAFVRERPIAGRSDFVGAYMPPYPLQPATL